MVIKLQKYFLSSSFVPETKPGSEDSDSLDEPKALPLETFPPEACHSQFEKSPVFDPALVYSLQLLRELTVLQTLFLALGSNIGYCY